MSTSLAVPADSARELDERRLQLVAEQAAGLRWQIALTAAVVVAIVWQAVPAFWSLAWLAGVIVCRELRAVALQRLQADRSVPIARRLRRLVWWNVALGSANGSAAFFMPWLDTTYDAVLTMILVSWGAGAVSTSSTVMLAFIAYASLLFVPTATMWLATWSALGTGIASLVLMFFGVQIRFAKKNLQTFEESFRIRLEMDAMARSLDVERAAQASAREDAVRANLEKSRFLAAASHDLRQPLQAMALNSGELAYLLADHEVARPIARELSESVGELQAMLDALLDLSKLDAGAVVPRPRAFPLARLLDALATSFRPASVARGLAIRVDCPPELVARTDPELLRRILANLVDNAIKFTATGTIELAAAAQEGRIRLEVRDTGPGIAAADQERVFEDLVQLDNAERDRARGHGLGLGIVRRMAALLELGLELRSTEGLGTTMGMTLEAAAVGAPAIDDAQAIAPQPMLDGCNVLVLDDDAMVRGAFIGALSRLGCQAFGVSSIAEAIAQAKRMPPDVAVVDYRLRDGATGLEAVTRLRELVAALPVVMVSADADETLRAETAGCDIALLRKPIDAARLGQALVAAIEARRARSQVEEEKAR